jgi:predicted DNA-binding transcriptional regulator AlpA
MFGPKGHVTLLTQEGAVMAKTADTVMTLQEVAACLKIARSTAYKLAQEGKIPGQKGG